MIKIFQDINALSDYAADLFVESAKEAVNQRGRFAVSLAGGSTPLVLYNKLSGMKIDWSKIHFFWGDERCVPVDDAESNYGQVKKILLDKIDAPEANVHRVNTDLDAVSAATDYLQKLADFADRLDLALLGVGDDAHTASLFPGSPIDKDASVVSVSADYQGRPANRVTLTPKVFNMARRIVFLVAGKSKAKAIFDTHCGKNNPLLFPTQRIAPINGELIWLVDEAAASLLDPGSSTIKNVQTRSNWTA